MKSTLLKHILLTTILLTFFIHAAPKSFAAQAGAPPAPASPEEVARGFYAFYLGELNKDNWSPLKKRREALKYLTPEYLRRVPRIIEQQMVDVLICAQDWDRDWAKNFTVQPASVRGQRATVVVRLPPFGGSGPAIDIKLTLLKRAGAWKINNTECLM